MFASKALLFSVVASGASAVLFLGPGGMEHDYVNCTAPNVVDNVHMVSALESLYPGETQEDSLDFMFQEEIACGDAITRDIEFNCQDFGGNSTCIKSSSDNSGGEVEAQGSSVNQDSGEDEGNVQARADSTVRCSEFTGQCFNEYQSRSGYCNSGYTSRSYDVKGYLSDVWCVKECTDDERKMCQNAQCNRSKRLCGDAGSGSFLVCGDALKECKGQRIKMAARLCTEPVLSRYEIFFGAYCHSHKLQCLLYADGYCSVNATALELYRKSRPSFWR